ncbi:MAG: PQQ-dependent sugar dehydrogenase [Solimonas sp.]
MPSIILPRQRRKGLATATLVASLCAGCTLGTAALSPPLETRPRNATALLPAFPGQTRAPGIDSRIELDVQTVAQGLDKPWAFEFLPDGSILLTEKPGKLRILGKDGRLSAPVEGLPPVLEIGQGGLLDVALDPDFGKNHVIYWSYAEARESGNGTTLARGVLERDGMAPSLHDVQVIFRQEPALESRLHFGSRIAFARDGTLFLTLGERSILEGRVQAEDLRSDLGKVIRINRDGSVPKDNPFVATPDARPEIWSYGHRNVQAAAIDPATGKLWTVEHGPRGGDELNQPQAGRDYGWPTITYGIEYKGDPVGAGISARKGLEQPVYYWDPVIAPSGMTFYTGKMFPEWQGSIFIGGLASTKLVRLQMRKGRVAGEEWLLQGRRIRDVRQGPDDALYIITDGPGGELLRIARKASKS